MTITNANIFSESYSEFKSFLGKITDPRSRYKANWIHSSMPNINQKGFDGYPFIILKVNVGEDKFALDTRVSSRIFRVLISIWSPESTEVDTISDSLLNNLKTETNLTEFDIVTMDSSPLDWDLDKNGKKILFRSINLIARKRL